MRLLVAGDIHGNAAFVENYLYPTAAAVKADAIVQLGDFGYWEHEPDGVVFLDLVEQCAVDYDIPLYWLRGNHDKISLCLRRYGHDRTDDGFVICRPHVLHIPDGHVWTWAGARMRAFGGAYSVDKRWRLDQEAKRQRALLSKEQGRLAAGRPRKPVPSTAGTLWFPEEELTGAEFAELLAADSSKLDIILSHDKPASSNLGHGIDLKNDPECRTNQDNLQRALTAHTPTFWLHGHLHHLYEDTVRCGDDDSHTRVVGLGCDQQAGGRFWRPTDAWCLLDLDTTVTLTHGRDVALPIVATYFVD